MSGARIVVALAVALAACSGGGGSAPRITAHAARDAAADAGGVPAGDARSAPVATPAAEPGVLVVQAVWPSPAAALLRSPGLNSCGRPRPAALPVAPAGVIADRYATERAIALSVVA